MVKADAVPEPFANVAAIRAAELEVGDARGDLGFLFLRANLEAGEILRALGGFGLREVDDVDGRLAFVHELLDRVRERDLGVGVLEGHGALAGLYRHRRATLRSEEHTSELQSHLTLVY